MLNMHIYNVYNCQIIKSYTWNQYNIVKNKKQKTIEYIFFPSTCNIFIDMLGHNVSLTEFQGAEII